MLKSKRFQVVNPIAIENLSPVCAQLVRNNAGAKSSVDRVAFDSNEQATIGLIETFATVEQAARMNIKATRRFVESVRFITNKTLGFVNKATCFQVAIVLSMLQSRVTYNSVHIALGYQKEGSGINGISPARLEALYSLIAKKRLTKGTITSQTSRTLGERGFFTALGIVQKTARGEVELLNPSHPLLTSYAGALSALSSEQWGALLLKLESDKSNESESE